MTLVGGTCEECGRRYSAVQASEYETADGRVGLVYCPWCDHLDQRLDLDEDGDQA